MFIILEGVRFLAQGRKYFKNMGSLLLILINLITIVDMVRFATVGLWNDSEYGAQGPRYELVDMVRVVVLWTRYELTSARALARSKNTFGYLLLLILLFVRYTLGLATSGLMAA